MNAGMQRRIWDDTVNGVDANKFKYKVSYSAQRRGIGKAACDSILAVSV